MEGCKSLSMWKAFAIISSVKVTISIFKFYADSTHVCKTVLKTLIDCQNIFWNLFSAPYNILKFIDELIGSKSPVGLFLCKKVGQQVFCRGVYRDSAEDGSFHSIKLKRHYHRHRSHSFQFSLALCSLRRVVETAMT